MAVKKSTSKPAVKETPKREEIGFIYLAERLEKISSHIDDLSTLLEENQDRFNLDPMIHGVQRLLEFYASELADMGQAIRKPQEGGAE
jgi:hypothetical protein